MKYGIAINNKTSKPIKEVVKAFEDEHWERIMKMQNSGWIQMPKEKVFISFNEYDRRRMQILKKHLSESELVEPMIVEDKRKGSIQLAELVIQSIKECKFFIPILSHKSIKTQWVNQEIGFVKSQKKIEIIPIVQGRSIRLLKGFIHKELQLSYKFEISENTIADNSQFGKLSAQILKYLESIIKKQHKILT